MPRKKHSNNAPPVVMTTGDFKALMRFSEKHVRDLVKDGSVPAHGDKGAYRIPIRWVAERYGLTVEDVQRFVMEREGEPCE